MSAPPTGDRISPYGPPPAPGGGSPAPTPGYGLPYPDNPYAARKNKFGVAAVVCGLLPVACWLIASAVALFFGSTDLDFVNNVALILGSLWLPASVTAIVLGVMGMQAAGRGEASNHGVAASGLVLGIVGVAFWVILMCLALIFTLPFILLIDAIMQAFG